MLARSLVGQNKLDEAEKELRALLEEKLPLASTLAWGNIVLGEIALRKGQAAEAVRRYNEGLRADTAYDSLLAARNGRLKAEAASSSAPQPDATAVAFIKQMDQTIKTGSKAEIDALIVPGELASFSKGIIGSRPEVWETRVVRTEQLDANHLAIDITLKVRQFQSDKSGTAVLILARVGNAWKLSGIELLEVR